MSIIDFDALLYGPAHAILGDTEAELTLACGEPPVTLTMIDETAGVVTGGSGGRFSAEVQTIAPAASVRAALLTEKGITVDSLPEASLKLSGKMWKVETYSFRASPQGEARGEVVLILKELKD